MQRSGTYRMSQTILGIVLCLSLLIQSVPAYAATGYLDNWESPNQSTSVPSASGLAPSRDLAPTVHQNLDLENGVGRFSPTLAELRAAQSQGKRLEALQASLTLAEQSNLYPPAVPGGPDPVRWAGRNRIQPSRTQLAPFQTVQQANVGLAVGWHLVSLPEEPADTSPAAVLASIDGSYTQVVVYQGCDAADPFKRYLPGDPAASDLAAIDHTMGFWVEMTQPDVLDLSGTAHTTVAIPLCTGWNLIGYPLSMTLPVAGALHSIAGQYSRVFAWDPMDSGDPWDVFDVAVPDWANDARVMEPGKGYWVLANQNTTLNFTQPSAGPQLSLESLLDGVQVTQPVTVTGLITSPTEVKWTWERRTIGETDWTVLANGSTAQSQPVGRFDPTILRNDMVTIRLTGTDLFGQTSVAQADVLVDGGMKPGLFSISFVDLTVPVAGMPISIIRTYDSRDKREGDFGVGWTLDIRAGTFKHNRLPGDGWFVRPGTGPFGLPCTEPVETKFHATEVRFSDVEDYHFELHVDMYGTGSTIIGGCVGDAHYEQVGGPPGASLELLDGQAVFWKSGQDQLFTEDTFATLFEPKRVRLTLLDGRTFDFALQEGLERVQDLNGNTLVIDENGITHSSGQSVSFSRDGQGRIERITDPNGNLIEYVYSGRDLIGHIDPELNATRFTYYPGHYLKDILDPRGVRVSRVEYDSDGRAIAIIDADENRTEYIHDIDGREEIVVNSQGHSTRFIYDERGNMLSQETTVTIEGQVTPVVTTYEYDNSDNIIAMTTPDNLRQESTLNGLELPTQIVLDPSGENLVYGYTYDSAGRKLTEQDPAGAVTTIVYNNSNGNATSFTDSMGHTHNIGYSTQGRVRSHEDPLGNQTLTTYDSNGYPASRESRDAQGTLLQSWSYTYDSNGNLLTATLQRTIDGIVRPLTTAYEYDGLNRVVKITDPLGQESHRVYTSFGAVSTAIDALGRQTVYTYDNLGRPIRTTYPDGSFATVAYDAAGNVAQTTDTTGRTTTFEYDELNRQVRTILPNGGVFETIYSPGGRQMATIDAKGNRTDFTYDTLGRPTITTAPALFDVVENALARPVSVQEYDPAGNVVALIRPDGSRTELTYDLARRPTQVTYADGSQRSYQYDALSRLVQVTDEEGRMIQYGYDALERLVSVTLPEPLPGQGVPVTTFAYDEAGNKVAQVDALGRMVRFEYDELNRMVAQDLPNGERARYRYDAAGNLLSTTDFNGNTTSYSYDRLDRPVTRTYPDTSRVEMAYRPDGQLQSLTDARGVTHYTYDGAGLLTNITNPDGSSLGYGYDLNGNLTTITTPAGMVQYEYTNLNAIDRVISPDGATDYGYDKNGLLRRVTHSDGSNSEYGFDLRRRLTSITQRDGNGVNLAAYTYALSPSGRRISVTELGGSVVTYGYDNMDRLIQENRTGSFGYDIRYGYDLVGNRIRTEQNGLESLYGYDDNDRLLYAGAVAYAYDANGNTVQMDDGGDRTEYSYDFENRLVGINQNGSATAFTYDPFGNRVARSDAGGDVAYLVDQRNPTGLAQVMEERDGNGGLQARYTYGLDLLEMNRTGTTYAFHHDGQLSARLLTSGGTVTDQSTYDAYGNLVGGSGSTPNPYGYTGEQTDAQSGFSYLRARYYNPEIGRFISSDPFPGLDRDPMTLHNYQYAHATPSNAVDPTGFISVSLSEISIVSAISSSLRSVNASFKTMKLCQFKMWVDHFATALAMKNIAGAFKIGLYQSTDVTGMLRGSQSLDTLFDAQQTVPGFQVEYTNPLANYPNVAQMEGGLKNKLRQFSLKYYHKPTIANPSGGDYFQDLEAWIDVSVQFFGHGAVNTEFPVNNPAAGQIGFGLTLAEFPFKACGFELGGFKMDFEGKGGQSSISYALWAKLAILGFAELKTKLVELAGNGPTFLP